MAMSSINTQAVVGIASTIPVTTEEPKRLEYCQNMGAEGF
jgi:hypothetical protein